MPWHRLHFPVPLAVKYGHVIEFWPVECGWGWGILLLILHALSLPFCWLDAEETLNASKALGDGRATRGQETKFLVITWQKLIRLYVINKLHCVKLLRFGAYLLYYLAFLDQYTQCQSLVNCWFRFRASRGSRPFLCKSRGSPTSFLLQEEANQQHLYKYESPTHGFPIYSSKWANELATIALGLFATLIHHNPDNQ